MTRKRAYGTVVTVQYLSFFSKLKRTVKAEFSPFKKYLNNKSRYKLTWSN